MPWTATGAGEAAATVEGRAAGVLGLAVEAAEGRAAGALGPAAAAAPGVEVSAGEVELRRTRGRGSVVPRVFAIVGLEG